MRTCKPTARASGQATRLDLAPGLLDAATAPRATVKRLRSFKRAQVPALLTISVLAGSAQADPNGLTFIDRDRDRLQATIAADLGYFAQENSWFGASRENLGEPSGSWWEAAVTPGLEFDLGTDVAGTFFGRVSGAGGYTWNGIDAAGTNAELGGVTKWRWEDAFLGWRAEDPSGALGLDSLELSAGRQKYQVGTGFLFWDQSSDGGDRGAYWVAPRKAADFLGLVRFGRGDLTGDLVYLKADDNPDTGTRIAGTTLDYGLGDLGGLGGGVYRIVDSKIATRDGMNVFDLRFDLYPIAANPALRLEGEYAYQRNGDRQAASGGYLKLGYLFETAPWTPTLSYRFAYFQGDDPGTAKDENFDPLYYGFKDWGTWYPGEILGEYVLLNQNLLVHTLQAHASPASGWDLNLFFYDFRLDDPRGFDSGVRSKDFAREVDLTVDWSATDHLSFSSVGAVALPGSAAAQYTGGSDDWWYLMLLASLRF